MVQHIILAYEKPLWLIVVRTRTIYKYLYIAVLDLKLLYRIIPSSLFPIPSIQIIFWFV